MSVSASCLYGAVRDRVSAPLRSVIACPCMQSRKTSGHHVAASWAPCAAISIEGAPAWNCSRPTARRGFCPGCGSNLFWDGPGETLSIMAGTLDGDPGIRLAGDIFCADKGACYDIPVDGAPQVAGADPSLKTQVP